jgi:hypothetical protein
MSTIRKLSKAQELKIIERKLSLYLQEISRITHQSSYIRKIIKNWPEDSRGMPPLF